MASDEYAPIYRAGFSVILEVGMADLIRPHLASLARISVVSDAIERRLDALMDGPHSHMHDFVTGLVARLVLDGDALPQAMAQEIASHWAGQNAAYMAHFEDEQIQVLLATAVPPELLGRSLKALAGA